MFMPRRAMSACSHRLRASVLVPANRSTARAPCIRRVRSGVLQLFKQQAIGLPGKPGQTVLGILQNFRQALPYLVRALWHDDAVLGQAALNLVDERGTRFDDSLACAMYSLHV